MPTRRGRSGVDAFFAKLPGQLTEVLRGAGRAGAVVITDEIKLQTPSDDVRANVRTRTKIEGGVITVRIDVKPGFARSRAIWLEYGTAPHFISVDERQSEGRTVKRINFLEKNEGSLVINGRFVGSTVRHPGAQRRPAFRPAIDTKADEAVAVAQRYIDSRVRRTGIVADSGEQGDEA